MANTLKFGNGQWAVKEGSTLAYNDENNNFKPLPFNFERDSRATVVNKDGLIETVGHNTPRIDYKDDSEGALLLEPQRTNLATYSEDFSDSSWSKANVDITNNSGIAPDGTVSLSSMDSNSSVNSEHRFRLSPSLSVLTTYNASIFVKSKDSGVYFYFRDLTNNSTSLYDVENNIALSTGVGQTVNSTSFGDFFRLDFTFTTPSSITNNLVDFGITSKSISGGITSVITAGQGMYFWGAQVEEGDYATSYIPTQGSIGTRYADVCNDAGNDQVFNDSEGVLFAEISALSDDLSERRISLNDGSTSNLIRLGYNNNSNTVLIAVYDGSNQVVLSHTLADITDSNKFAFKYKQNDYALWVNGIEVGTNTSSFVFPNGTLTNLSFNRGDNNVNFRFHGNTKQIQYFDTALSDAELKALTS